MESCLLIRNNNKSEYRTGKVLFIDAVDLIEIIDKQGFLNDDHITKIYDIYKSFSVIEGRSTVKTENEILENDGSLRIRDYLPKEVNYDNLKSFDEAFADWTNSSAELYDSINNLFSTL